jgi:hypothetical protein
LLLVNDNDAVDEYEEDCINPVNEPVKLPVNDPLTNDVKIPDAVILYCVNSLAAIFLISLDLRSTNKNRSLSAIVVADNVSRSVIVLFSEGILS